MALTTVKWCDWNGKMGEMLIFVVEYCIFVHAD